MVLDTNVVLSASVFAYDLLALRGRFACAVLIPEQFLGTLSEP